jgi:hypothetical protein
MTMHPLRPRRHASRLPNQGTARMSATIIYREKGCRVVCLPVPSQDRSPR